MRATHGGLGPWLSVAVTCTLAAACTPPPAAAPPPSVVIAPPSAPCPTPPPATAPAGEHWVAAGDAARLRTNRLTAADGYWVMGHVALDERHVARVYSVRSGEVSAIGATPGVRLHKGDRVLELQGVRPPGKIVIVSPIDGDVFSLGVALGSAVVGLDTDPKAATELAVVGDVDQVIVVSDRTPPLAHIGVRTTFVAHSAPNRQYIAVVSMVAPDDSRIRCEVPNHDHMLRVGDSGALHVEQVGARGLALSRTALLAGGASVLVKRGDAPDQRVRYVELPVTIVFDGGGAYLSVEGPAPEDEVVWDARAVH